MRRIAIIPAWNEAASVASVIEEIRAADPGFQILVVDDGSTDETARIAADAGARVLRLPYNLGIGGAMQSGYRYALEHGFDIAVQIDADGQHDPAELPHLLAPVLTGEVDVAVGSRFAGRGHYPVAHHRRLAMWIFARLISQVAGRRVSDSSSAFRAVSRRGIALFAADYPDGFLETVEATATATRHGLRLAEVPVTMRQRGTGRTSLTVTRSLYYAAAVVVSIAAGFRRRSAHSLES